MGTVVKENKDFLTVSLSVFDFFVKPQDVHFISRCRIDKHEGLDEANVTLTPSVKKLFTLFGSLL